MGGGEGFLRERAYDGGRSSLSLRVRRQGGSRSPIITTLSFLCGAEVSGNPSPEIRSSLRDAAQFAILFKEFPAPPLSAT